MTTPPTTQRPARPGERCTCGRPAVIVYITERFGEVGYCGIPDGGAGAMPQYLDADPDELGRAIEDLAP